MRLFPVLIYMGARRLHIRQEGFCMKGNVYSLDKCPICKQNFKRIGENLVCPEHKTTPHRYYIQFYCKEFHKYISVWSDSRGVPFSSYEQANRILTKMRAEVDAGTFDPTRYVSQKLKAPSNSSTGPRPGWKERSLRPKRSLSPLLTLKR